MKTAIKQKKAMKALSPEERTILANIKSLVEQIEQIEGEEPGEEAPVGEEEILAMGQEEEDENKKNKNADGIVKDETTASDDADARVEEDQPENTEDAIAAVKAMLENLTVSKKQKDPVIQAMVRMERTVKSRMDQQDNAIEGILEGLGVTKAVLGESIQKVEKPARKIQRDTDEVTELVVKALAPLFAKAADTTEESTQILNGGQSSQARKALKGILGPLFAQAPPKDNLPGQ